MEDLIASHASQGMQQVKAERETYHSLFPLKFVALFLPIFRNVQTRRG